jgi:ADP-heptose:LPS heptosyltransferase
MRTIRKFGNPVTSMGDVILASSLLDVLKRSYPDAGVTFFNGLKYVELFRV